ncbi:hypothetical protein O6H91_03G080400 [Diphasiastrum complanatum]|uniref:Uncharacterized protein n=1 Tax=Diphasiastrum complanatum TaxID=34168 RepID=A0ACC2E872_DIPCM|nr:hypothetical protein O6H91_03G080400 [Diphasiastrum complanatum]
MAASFRENISAGINPVLCGSIPPWTREEDKLFEKAMAVCDAETPHSWERIAAMVSGKDVVDVKRQFERLVEDVGRIEAGSVPCPNYANFPCAMPEERPISSTENFVENRSTAIYSLQEVASFANGSSGLNYITSLHGIGRRLPFKSLDQERRKGIPWTEEELFLLGLEKFGKGDWRSISRNFVVSRTPTQVASHAQKYFIRLNSMHKDKRRTSIHDITNVNKGALRPTTMEYSHNTNYMHSSLGLGMYDTSFRQPLLSAEGAAFCTPILVSQTDHGRSHGFRQITPNSSSSRQLIELSIPESTFLH